MKHAAALLVLTLLAAGCGDAIDPAAGSETSPTPTVAIEAPATDPLPVEPEPSPTVTPPSTPTAAPAPTVVPTPSREDPAFPTPVPPDELLPRLEEAYRDSLDALIEIQTDPDPDDPRLQEWFFSFGLLKRQEYLAGLVANGEVVLQPEDSKFHVEARQLTVSTAGGAIATFCMVDDTYTWNPRTGESRSVDGARFRVAVDFAFVDGRWKVTDEVNLAREARVLTCDGF